LYNINLPPTWQPCRCPLKAAQSLCNQNLAQATKRASPEATGSSQEARSQSHYESGRHNHEEGEEIEKARKTQPIIYRTEFEAEFIEDVETWLSQDPLAEVCGEELEYIPFEARAEGHFYAGVDLAERVDHTVVAVVRRSADRLDLVHMRRFPLGTSIVSCIGYVEVLSERWRRIHAVYVDNTKHGDYIV